MIIRAESTRTFDIADCHGGTDDVCVTRDGQRHSLVNSGSSPMRLLVVAAELGNPRSSASNPVPS